MRKISRLFILSWSITLQYRGDLVLWLTAITATPLLALAIWYTVAQSGQSAFTPQDMLTYFLLIMFIRIISSSWRGYRLIQQILNGDIVNYLLRPSFIYWEFVTTNLTTKALQLMIPLPIFLGAVVLAPQWFSPAIYQTSHILLFIPSLLIAAIITFTFDMSMGLLAFWLEDAQELMAYRFLLTQAASGIIIPFALMPDWLHQAFSLLPFRYMVSAPAEILLGQVTGPAAWQLFGYQILWTMGFIFVLRTLYVYGLRRYAIPGQ